MIYELLWIMLYFFWLYILSIIGIVCCGLIDKQYDKRFLHKTYEDFILIFAALSVFVYVILSYLAKFGGLITALVFVGYILVLLAN